ncbi:MAG: LysE family translocator, partial [Rhizobiaceae bacterium]|nr:LysE family translocator [Rhizobiaceae bacterium]
MTFVPDLSTILQFAVATVVIAITPGPDMTLFVGRAISEGRAAGFACMAGAMCGCLIHTSLVALGLSALILASPEAFLALKIGGAGYLIWLAFQAVVKGSAFSPDTVKRAPRSLWQNWATGIGINLLNPKIILFFMTFLPQFVSAHDPQAAGKLFFLGFLFIVV